MHRRTMLQILLVASAMAPVAAAQTSVSGSISTTTWTADGSPYRVAGVCSVMAGDTLTIEPGVDVVFDVDAHLGVWGTLLAIGTESDSIRFTKGTAEKWGGISLSSPGRAELAHVRVGDPAAHPPPGDPQVRDGGVHLWSGTRLDMSNSVVTGCRGTGVAAGGASAFLEHCTIDNNSGGGGWRGWQHRLRHSAFALRAEPQLGYRRRRTVYHVWQDNPGELHSCRQFRRHR